MSPVLPSYPGIGTMPFAKLHLSSSTHKNPRTSSGLSPESIRELALHIGNRGLMNALIVTSDGLVIAGQRRYLAIEWLIQWFTPNEDQDARLDSEPDAAEFIGNLDHEGISRLEAAARRFVDAVPIRVMDNEDLGERAIADNLLREGLSGYEIAKALLQLHERGRTHEQLAHMIGKSKAYISLKLSSLRNAGPEVQRAWEAGEITEDAVQRLAAKPREEQPAELASTPRGPVPRRTRGAVARPPFDLVKNLLEEVQSKPSGPAVYKIDAPASSARDGGSVSLPAIADAYRAGVLDALRWVAGQQTSKEFVKLVEGGGS